MNNVVERDSFISNRKTIDISCKYSQITEKSSENKFYFNLIKDLLSVSFFSFVLQHGGHFFVIPFC